MKKLEDINAYAKEHHVPVMMEDGLEYMLDLLKQYQVHSFLEIGTAIARTSLAVAQLDPKMKIVTIERDPNMIAQAKINIASSDHAKQITLIEGDALEVEIPNQKFDCIFIDAAKGQYQRFFVKYAPFLSENGIIISDNMFFHGLVEHPERTNNRNTKALVRKIAAYQQFLKEQEKYETQFLSVGDGIALTRKKAA
jgi:predicted O-methyltransferase YrrM